MRMHDDHRQDRRRAMGAAHSPRPTNLYRIAVRDGPPLVAAGQPRLLRSPYGANVPEGTIACTWQHECRGRACTAAIAPRRNALGSRSANTATRPRDRSRGRRAPSSPPRHTRARANRRVWWVCSSVAGFALRGNRARARPQGSSSREAQRRSSVAALGQQPHTLLERKAVAHGKSRTAPRVGRRQPPNACHARRRQ